jgi:hypothetical protein
VKTNAFINSKYLVRLWLMTDEKLRQQDGTDAMTSLQKQFISIQAPVLQKRYISLPSCGDIEYALLNIHKNLERMHVSFTIIM